MLKRALYRDTDGGVADLSGNGVAADAIGFVPAGTIAATDVQAAIEEVAAEAGDGAVSSVFGRTGAVLAAPGDYSASDVGAQPVDSDLTAIAALSTTSYGRAFLALADAAAARTAIGAVIGTDVEAHDADLTTIAGLSPTNDDLLQRKSGAWTNRTMAQLISDLAALGTTFQPLDSDLTAIAALSTTSFGRGLLAEASAATARTTLGIPAAVGGVEWTVVTKASDESVASSTTVQADDELKFTTVSGGQYEFELDIIYANPTGAGVPDIKVSFGEDATVRGGWTLVPRWQTNDGISITTLGVQNTHTDVMGTAAANRIMKGQGTLTGGGGTAGLYWAQSTSDTNATIVRAGSLLRYRRIL